MNARNDAGNQMCALCKRLAPGLTRHHLIPRTTHRRARMQRQHTRQERHSVILLCRPCHKQIHAVLTETELARSYRSVDALMAHPDIAKFVQWVSRQPATGDVVVRASRDKLERKARPQNRTRMP